MRRAKPGPEPPADPLRAAYADALRRLARRDYSREELRLGLAGSGHGADAIEAALARLAGQRYLDDRDLAARLARSRLRHRGVGQHRIRQDLRRKGVEKADAEAGVREALADVSETETLDAVARAFWRSHDRDPPPQRMRKMWVFLMRRGFPGSLVHDRLRALFPRWREALDDLPLDEP